MNFCNILPVLRAEKGLKQKDLATMLGFSNNLICEWEKGRSNPNIETLKILADFFECTIDYLVGREDDFGIVAVKSDLSEEEKELISCFNKMDDIQKRAILMTARSFAKNKTEELLPIK